MVVPQGEQQAAEKPTLLEYMNTKHALIEDYGGKCVVLSWRRWHVNRKVLVPVFQTVDDIKRIYHRHRLWTDKGLKSYADWWLDHPHTVSIAH